MPSTDELFAELRRSFDRTLEERVKTQVESMSLQITILTAQINALAQQLKGSPSTTTAALSREQVTKLVSDALVRSLEGQPFTLDGAQPAPARAAAAAAPAAPAPAPVPAASPRPSAGTSNAARSGRDVASSSRVAGPVEPPRPASNAASLGRPEPRRSTIFDLEPAREDDDEMSMLSSLSGSYGFKSSKRPATSSSSNIAARRSDIVAARPSTSSTTAATSHKRKSLGDSSSRNIFYPTSLSDADEDLPGPSRPRKSATTSANRVSALSQRAVPALERWTGSLPAATPTKGEGAWLAAALQWTEGGAGLAKPLKKYAPSWGSSSAAFRRRMAIGKEYERLGCSVRAFKKLYPSASFDGLTEVSSKIQENTYRRNTA